MLKSVAIAALLAGLVLPAHADEVSDTIRDALSNYESGNTSAASQSLNYAVQLLSQISAERFATLLPEALPGWQAGEVDSQSAGMALFGGGMQASRDYTRGSATVNIEMLGDSPLLGQFIGIFSNPAMMSAMGKPIRVGSQTGLEDPDGKLVFVVANRFMINIGGDAPRADKLAYAGALDFAALSTFGN